MAAMDPCVTPHRILHSALSIMRTVCGALPKEADKFTDTTLEFTLHNAKRDAVKDAWGVLLKKPAPTEYEEVHGEEDFEKRARCDLHPKAKGRDACKILPYYLYRRATNPCHRPPELVFTHVKERALDSKTFQGKSAVDCAATTFLNSYWTQDIFRKTVVELYGESPKNIDTFVRRFYTRGSDMQSKSMAHHLTTATRLKGRPQAWFSLTNEERASYFDEKGCLITPSPGFNPDDADVPILPHVDLHGVWNKRSLHLALEEDKREWSSGVWNLWEKNDETFCDDETNGDMSSESRKAYRMVKGQDMRGKVLTSWGHTCEKWWSSVRQRFNQSKSKNLCATQDTSELPEVKNTSQLVRDNTWTLVPMLTFNQSFVVERTPEKNTIQVTIYATPEDAREWSRPAHINQQSIFAVKNWEDAIHKWMSRHKVKCDEGEKLNVTKTLRGLQDMDTAASPRHVTPIKSKGAKKQGKITPCGGPSPPPPVDRMHQGTKEGGKSSAATPKAHPSPQ